MSEVQGWQAFLKGSRLDRRSREEYALKPLWTINLDDDEAVVEWHKQVSETLEDSHNERVANYVRNRNLYAGMHQHLGRRISEVRDPLSEWNDRTNLSPEIIVNHTYELTEQWVAKLSAFSAEVEVLPVNTEEGDRNKARASQRFADDLAEKNDFKALMLRLIRDSKIGGEAYIVVDYDENIGDLHPAAKKAKELRVPLTDSKGNQIIGEDGQVLMVDTNKRIGDLVYRLRSVPEILLQPKQRWSDVEWYREVELVDVDELKRQYPDKHTVIDNAAVTSAGKVRNVKSVETGNEVFVYTYWHKRTKALDSGRKIVLLDDAVLFNDVHPFSGAPLNLVRLTDIDLEGELHGWSFINNIATMQFALNKLYTKWYTNIALGSHLYWLIPANARVARDKIRNSSSVIQYHGTQKPEIAIFRTISGEVIQLIEKLEQRILTISRIQATSRGELPPNVEAGVAIGILEEQEEQSAIPDVKKVNAAIEKLFSLSLGVAGDKYDKSDGRTARILGKEGEYLLEALDTAKLSGPYDIKTKKTTALSKSKALMTQEITQLEAMRPGIFSSEEIYDLLQLGDRDKFYDIATAAKRTAEFENERMREGYEVSEPKEGEFHLVHWKAHMLVLQTPSFKAQVKEEIRAAFEDHIRVTEMFLTEQAKNNIKLATMLAEEAYFPSFYIPDFTIPQIITALQSGAKVPLMGEVDDAGTGLEASQLAGLPTGQAEVPLPETQAPEEMADVPMQEPAPTGEPITPMA